jgi:uncharacterized membrane protein
VSASTFFIAQSALVAAAPQGSWRFGVPAAPGAMQWVLRRNCSITPRQLLAAYAALCALSLSVALAAWMQGARWVGWFASVEWLAVAAALLVFARHAGDCERIVLDEERLSVEHASGRKLERWQAAKEWVRVGHDGRSLVELSCGATRCEVGRYLRPELRPLLADELRAALRERR